MSLSLHPCLLYENPKWNKISERTEYKTSSCHQLQTKWLLWYWNFTSAMPRYLHKLHQQRSHFTAASLTSARQKILIVIPWHTKRSSDFANSICPGLAYKQTLYIVDGWCFWWRRNSERNNTQLNTPVKHTPVKQATPHSQLLPTVWAAKGLPWGRLCCPVWALRCCWQQQQQPCSAPALPSLRLLLIATYDPWSV